MRTRTGAPLEAAGLLVLSGKITPAALTGDVNDYGPAGNTAYTVWRLDPGAAARNVTGLAGGRAGAMVLITNISETAARNLTLKHESGSSAAGNRILGSNLADVVIRPCGSCLLRYDAVRSRWRPVVI